jgi:hypothetical protein
VFVIWDCVLTFLVLTSSTPAGTVICSRYALSSSGARSDAGANRGMPRPGGGGHGGQVGAHVDTLPAQGRS